MSQKYLGKVNCLLVGQIAKLLLQTHQSSDHCQARGVFFSNILSGFIAVLVCVSSLNSYEYMVPDSVSANLTFNNTGPVCAVIIAETQVGPSLRFLAKTVSSTWSNMLVMLGFLLVL